MDDLGTLPIAARSGVVEQGAFQSPVPRLTFRQGFWLPLTHMLRPRAMGAAFAGCPAAAQTLSVMAGLAVLSLTVFGLVVFEDRLPGSGFAESLARSIHGRNRADGQAALFGAPLGFIGVSMILAVLRFSGLHRSGSVWQTLARGLRSSLLLVWPAVPGRFDWVEALAIPMVPGCVCPLVGWLWHRGIGAFVALGVAWQSPLRDGRWLLKLLNYESCYLLLHCVFNGTLLSVFILAPKQFEALMQAITGLRGVVGIPWGVVIVLLGNLALGVIWLARYGRTVRAIRWNNF